MVAQKIAVTQTTTAPTTSSSSMCPETVNKRLQAAAALTPQEAAWPSRTGDVTNYVIDLMTDEQITQTFDMIMAAAQSGQGFGVGEYDDEDDFRQDISGGFRFAIMDKSTREMVACFILNESRYTRGCRVADPYIIVRDDQRGRGLGKLCMELALKFAPSLDFIGMYADTFSNNTAMIRIIQNIPGFKKVGDLPMGGVMASGEVVGSVVYYKDFRTTTGSRPDVNNNRTTSQTG